MTVIMPSCGRADVAHVNIGMLGRSTPNLGRSTPGVNRSTPSMGRPTADMGCSTPVAARSSAPVGADGDTAVAVAQPSPCLTQLQHFHSPAGPDDSAADSHCQISFHSTKHNLASSQHTSPQPAINPHNPHHLLQGTDTAGAPTFNSSATASQVTLQLILLVPPKEAAAYAARMPPGALLLVLVGHAREAARGYVAPLLRLTEFLFLDDNVARITARGDILVSWGLTLAYRVVNACTLSRMPLHYSLQ